VEKRVVLVGDAAENPAALDSSRQAAAKRADRARRGVHDPQGSPSDPTDDGVSNDALHCQCAVVGVAGDLFRKGNAAVAAWAGRRECAERRCS
jgi:hypothetical protein